MPLPGPANTSLPSVSGSNTVGSTVSTTNGTWSDFGGSINRYGYQWLRNGSAIGGATGSSYTLTDSDDGRSIQCQVTAYDDVQGLSASSTSGNSISCVEPAPTFNSVSISGTAKVGSTLSASASINHMGGAGGSSSGFTWKRNGSSVATGTNYTLTSSDDGATITVTCSASNTGGSASATSGGVGVTYPAPTNTVAPATTGSPVTGQVLTCDGGSWSTSVSKSYQWQRDNSGGGTYSDIPGATSSTYTLVAADVTCNVRCHVTASNDGGSASANSNALGPVTGAPVNTVAPAVTGTAKVGQTLSTTNGTWDYSPTSYSYRWQRDTQGDGVFGDIAGATSSTYVLQTADAGCQVRCTVLATNANGTGTANSNNASRIQQPTFLVTAPRITDPNIYVGGTVTCDGGTWGGYPAPTVRYRWQYSADDATWSYATQVTFGRTAIGPVADSGYSGYKAATKYTAADNGALFSIGLYLTIATSPVNARAMLYADSAGVPGALLAHSSDQSVPVGASQLVTFPISYGEIISGTAYWLAVGFDGGGGSVSVFCENAGTGAHSYRADPTASDPFGTATVAGSAGDMDVRANVGKDGGVTFVVPTTLAGDWIRCEVTADNGV